MEWIIPIIAITIGAVIVAFLLIPKRKRGRKTAEDKAPLCPGCSVDSCPAMGGETDIGAVREMLEKRARESVVREETE